ncbi:MAG: dihydrolipoyl dehydrogenase [Campylobacterota bacterium]|nr:dihydrolipoyl dehydrogenase [Campylobacterota bacterium]
MYDAIVIGAGVAGCDVAIELASAGKTVCLIDKSEAHVGGTCLNEGCIPAKNFLETASYIKKSSYFKNCGVDLTLNSFDIEGLKHNTSELIAQLKGGVFAQLKKHNVELRYATASFVDKNTICVRDDNTNELIRAKNIIIATGSMHKNHPSIALAEDKIISSKEVFALKEIPKSILIIGGGAIGCEFATFFNALGCEVQISEFTPNLVPSEDVDVAKALKRELEKQGIKVHLKSNVIEHEIVDEGVQITLDLGKKQEVKTYDKVLISIGRSPNTASLNLNKVGIKSDRGFIEVNSELQAIGTDYIYAIGDALKSPALAHIASYEAKRVAQSILEKETMDEKTIFPSVIFCTPQVASIGQSEKELKELEIDFKVKKHFFKSSGKAKIKGDDSGFVKIMVETNTQKILGAAIIGNEATELIHQFLIAINSNLSTEDLSKMIFAHPTLSEVILEMVHT